jgi:hypothetical protein
MSERLEDIKRIVADLEAHLATVEASVAALKALLAEDDGAGPAEKTSVDHG